MSYRSYYHRAVLEARRLYTSELRPVYIRRLYDEYVAAIGRLALEVEQSGGISAARATALRVQILDAARTLERRYALLISDGERRAMETAVEGHREAMRRIHAAITEEGATLPVRGGVAALTASFGGVPEEAVQAMMVRRGLGLAESFQTLLSRRVAHVGPHVDRMISYALQTGMSADRLAAYIAGAIGREDPVLAEAVRRASGPAGALMRRAARQTMETPEEMKALRRLFYDARRIAVTEINTAYFEAHRVASVRSPLVDLVRWTTSRIHHRPDICSVLARLDLHRYGPGLYHPESAPAPPHPHCMCHLAPVLRPPSEWDKPRRAVPVVRRFHEEEVRAALAALMPEGGTPTRAEVRTTARELRNRLRLARRYAILGPVGV